MNSVKNNEHTIIIKNSKFICLTYSVGSIEEINNILKEVKVKYYDATHRCYAYILDNIKKESDDGEPSGTAGIPMMLVLEKNNQNHVLCIVVRYFGKIKLGAGGLVRAYTKSVTETIKDNIVTLVDGVRIIIKFDYDNIKNIDYILKDTNIINKEFKDKIIYEVDIDKYLLEKLKNINNTEIELVSNIYITPNN